MKFRENEMNEDVGQMGENFRDGVIDRSDCVVWMRNGQRVYIKYLDRSLYYKEWESDAGLSSKALALKARKNRSENFW